MNPRYACVLSRFSRLHVSYIYGHTKLSLTCILYVWTKHSRQASTIVTSFQGFKYKLMQPCFSNIHNLFYQNKPMIFRNLLKLLISFKIMSDINNISFQQVNDSWLNLVGNRGSGICHTKVSLVNWRLVYFIGYLTYTSV